MKTETQCQMQQTTRAEDLEKERLGRRKQIKKKVAVDSFALECLKRQGEKLPIGDNR